MLNVITVSDSTILVLATLGDATAQGNQGK